MSHYSKASNKAIALGAMLSVRNASLDDFKVLFEMKLPVSNEEFEKKSTYERSRLLNDSFEKSRSSTKAVTAPELIELQEMHAQIIKLFYVYLCTQVLSKLSADHNKTLIKAIRNKTPSVARKNLGHWRRVALILVVDSVKKSIQRHCELGLSAETLPSIGLKSEWLKHTHPVSSPDIIESILNQESKIFNNIVSLHLGKNFSTRFEWLAPKYNDFGYEIGRYEKDLLKLNYEYLRATKSALEAHPNSSSLGETRLKDTSDCPVFTKRITCMASRGRPKKATPPILKKNNKRAIQKRVIPYMQITGVFIREYISYAKANNISHITADREIIDIIYGTNFNQKK